MKLRYLALSLLRLNSNTGFLKLYLRQPIGASPCYGKKKLCKNNLGGCFYLNESVSCFIVVITKKKKKETLKCSIVKYGKRFHTADILKFLVDI